MIRLIEALSGLFYVLDFPGILTGGVKFATCVFVIGGIFFIYTAVREFGHMLSIEHLDADVGHKSGKPLRRWW